MQLPADAKDRLGQLLARISSGEFVAVSKLRRSRRVPMELSFGPDLCFAGQPDAYLIYDLGIASLPSWVKSASDALDRFKRTHVMVLTRESKELPAVKLASSVIKECHSLGFGVITDTGGKSNLVLPPRY